VPYRIQTRLAAARYRWCYYRNRLAQFCKWEVPRSAAQGRILIYCGFHGKSGGTYAIANIANLLAGDYQVKFVSHPQSIYNSLLSHRVQIVTWPDPAVDLVLCDVSCPNEFLREAGKEGKRRIVTCHGLPHALHGLGYRDIITSLELADQVHFVAAVQQAAFQFPLHRCRIIPNTTAPIRKTRRGHNVGIVGDLREDRKNVREALEVAVGSTADRIHLWGAADGGDLSAKVRAHRWESDKARIYNSFDVLVHLSRLECCPMVVIESLSVGIPCLLSSIAAHEQFRLCPGVELVDSSDPDKAVAALNRLLAAKDGVREPIVRFWQENYSEPVIRKRWREMISEVIG
jgi:hypothetical protein